MRQNKDAMRCDEQLTFLLLTSVFILPLPRFIISIAYRSPGFSDFDAHLNSCDVSNYDVRQKEDAISCDE
jgi:hypothetical protein